MFLGLAQAAVHQPLPSVLFNFESSHDATELLPDPQGVGCRYPSSGPSVLEILAEVYRSSILKPALPYDPDALLSARMRAVLADGRPEEIRRICSQLQINETLGDSEFDAKVEELIWAATLLMFSTGKEGRKPRLDFFLMHLVTPSLFFKSYFSVLQNPAHKAKLIRAFVPSLILLTLARGRPIIKPELLMRYTDKPRPPLPPASLPQPSHTSLGNPLEDNDYNPWPNLASSALYAPDSHVLKTLRTLMYAAREYGDTPMGGAIGASLRGGGSKEETIKGISKIDGTIFVRAAGMMMDYMPRLMLSRRASFSIYW